MGEAQRKLRVGICHVDRWEESRLPLEEPKKEGTPEHDVLASSPRIFVFAFLTPMRQADHVSQPGNESKRSKRK